jgi:hypothetical protein
VIVDSASHGWKLHSSDYCEAETRHVLPRLGRSAAAAWKTEISPLERFIRADLALDKPLIFPKAKDRPFVVTAPAARAEWLITLDTTGFHGKRGRE